MSSSISEADMVLIFSMVGCFVVIIVLSVFASVSRSRKHSVSQEESQKKKEMELEARLKHTNASGAPKTNASRFRELDGEINSSFTSTGTSESRQGGKGNYLFGGKGAGKDSLGGKDSFGGKGEGKESRSVSI